jgi:hypothetical protein
MTALEERLCAIAEPEAWVRQETCEMLEIVTSAIGDLEDAGDDLTQGLALDQKGRTTYAGGGFIGRWTHTKQNLDNLLEKQNAMKRQLDQGLPAHQRDDGTPC